MAPRETRTIDIEAFVDLADVDPVYFDHPYFLVPSGESEGARRAYALLVDVLATTQRRHGQRPQAEPPPTRRRGRADRAISGCAD